MIREWNKGAVLCCLLGRKAFAKHDTVKRFCRLNRSSHEVRGTWENL